MRKHQGKLFLLLSFVTALVGAAYGAPGAVVVPQCKTSQDLHRHWMWVGDYTVMCGVTRVVIDPQRMRAK